MNKPTAGNPFAIKGNPFASSVQNRNPFATRSQDTAKARVIDSVPYVPINGPGIQNRDIKAIPSHSSQNSLDGYTTGESREVSSLPDVFHMRASQSPITPTERFMATPTNEWGRAVCDLDLPGKVPGHFDGKTLTSQTVSEVEGYKYLRRSGISSKSQHLTEVSGGQLNTKIDISATMNLQIGNPIAGGATATVSKGVLTLPNGEIQEVAAKKVSLAGIRPDVTDLINRCIREKEILDYLSDLPGVVKCHDFFPFANQGNRNLAFVLSLEGPSLAALLHPSSREQYDSVSLNSEGNEPDSIVKLSHSTPMEIDPVFGRIWFRPVEESKTMVDSLIDTVADICDRGVLHLDLKPANILLGKDGLPKVCDFGYSKYKNEDGFAPKPEQYTNAYAAPEISNGRGPSSEKSDVYSLGCVLYEIYTGTTFSTAERTHIPNHVRATGGFQHADVVNRILKLTKGGDDPKLPEFNLLRRVPGMDDHLFALIQDMLNIDPDVRPTLRNCQARFRDPAFRPDIGRQNITPSRDIFNREIKIKRSPNLEMNHSHLDAFRSKMASVNGIARSNIQMPKVSLMRADIKRLAQENPDLMIGRKTSVDPQKRSVVKFAKTQMSMDPNAVGVGGFGKVKRSKKLVNETEVDVAIKRSLKTLNPVKALKEIIREHRIQSQFSACDSILKSYGVGYYESNKAIHLGSAVNKFEIPKFGEGETAIHPFVELEPAAGHFNVPKSGIPLDVAIDHFIKLASAVELLHQHEVVHRDLKYANILLGTDGVLKITDFGSAVEKIAPGRLVKQSAAGTPILLPPETLGLTDGKMQGVECVCHESDWYSLGYVFSLMITGQSHTKNESFYLPNRPKYPDLPKLKERLKDNVFRRNIETDMMAKGIPRPMIDLLLKMTEFNPKNRPTDSYIIAELRAIKVSLPVAPQDDGPDEKSSPY